MHDIRILVNERVILLFREGFNFTKLRMFRENKTLAKIFEFTVLLFTEQQKTCYEEWDTKKLRIGADMETCPLWLS